MRVFGGEDDRIKVVSTADGSYAMGWYAPELLQPYGDVGMANWWFIVPPDPLIPTRTIRHNLTRIMPACILAALTVTKV